MSEKYYDPRKMGMSMAATWSWGASLLVGIGIVSAWGLIPYLVWLVGNILAIPLFGVIYKYLPNARFWKNLMPFVLLWVFIQSMAIIMNLNFLQSTMTGREDVNTAISMDTTTSLFIIYALGIALWLYIMKKRLFGSYFTDLIQYKVQIIGAICLAVVALYTTGINDFTWIANGGVNWAIFGFIGIITGVTAAAQQWQRLEKVDESSKITTTLWGGFWFGLYMIPCAIVAVAFTGGLVETLLLITIVLAITTSTIDSGYAGLQYIGERFNLPHWIPNAFSLIVLLSFPLMASWGVVQIWSFYAGVRWKIVVGLIVATLIYNHRDKLFINYWTNKKFIEDETTE